jgi:putative membrane protein
MDARETSATAAADSSLGVLLGAVAVLGAGLVTLPFFQLGPLSTHMAVHIASMNVAAPLLAAALIRARPSTDVRASPLGLWSATILQLVLLWAAHSPALHHAAHGSPLILAAMHASLFVSALAFWMNIARPNGSRWQAMLALLVSGKLACLLGVLLIFAPRLLFAAPDAEHLGHGAATDVAPALADQHLAGLLMIAACPLSYVLAAVVIAAQTVLSLDAAEQPSSARAGRMPAG